MRNYATQMDAAKRGIVTPEIETVAKKENRPVEFIMERVAKGTIAIPANINHKSLSAEAVGDGTRVKINVNLGISGDCKDYEMELRKVRMAVDMGAESIMDLSNYGKTNTFRKQLIDMSPAMIGTVPMYDAIGYLEKDLLEITAQDFLKVVEAHAREGVDFMTIHAGINRRAVEAFMREGRRMNIVSRGGSLLFAWMKMTGNENPFFEYYDEVLDILRRYDVTISLGDALRPGCIDDASDAGQISELIELGNLAQRAWAKDVQVMIEGPGHMAMNEIAANMQMEKRICHGAPFYVLGPTSTIDADCPTGASIPIEQRDPAEVTEAHYAQRMAPRNVKVYNPAFDVTPCDLITAIVTERGIARPPFDDALRAWSLPGRAGR